MLKLLLTTFLLLVLYFVLFKLLPVIGAAPYLISGLKPTDIFGGRLFVLTLIYVPLALLTIYGVAFLKGHGIKKLFMSFNTSDIYIGVAAGILIAFINLGIDMGLKSVFRENFTETLRQIGNSPSGLIAMIGVAWLAGGILEEVFWRGFWFTEWKAALGNTTPALVFCVVTSAIFFGLSHLYQGTSGAVSSGIAGLGLGLLFLWRGNIVAPIIAHGIMDTLLLPIIWFWFGKS